MLALWPTFSASFPCFSIRTWCVCICVNVHVCKYVSEGLCCKFIISKIPSICVRTGSGRRGGKGSQKVEGTKKGKRAVKKIQNYVDILYGWPHTESLKLCLVSKALYLICYIVRKYHLGKLARSFRNSRIQIFTAKAR